MSEKFLMTWSKATLLRFNILISINLKSDYLISQEQHDWIFKLFKENMKNLYKKSHWVQKKRKIMSSYNRTFKGYDEPSKQRELQDTTSNYLIIEHLPNKVIIHVLF